MGSRHLLVGAILAAAVLPAPHGNEGVFNDPEIIGVRAPGGSLAIRARRGTASIPGLGEVEQVYGYDVHRGTAFPPERPGPTTVQLMPPVIAVDRGIALRILYRNELLTTDVAGKSQPTDSNLHTHGLIVSPQGTGLEGKGDARAYGDCIFAMAFTAGSRTGGHAHGSPAPGSADQSGDPCSLDSGTRFVRENGDIRCSYMIARYDPTGMYCCHPHPHGGTEGQASNGHSALLAVGTIWRYPYRQGLIPRSADHPVLEPIVSP